MNIKQTITIFLLTIPLLAGAQSEVFKGEHFIEVTGIASQEIEPNEIYLMISLREFELNREKVALEKIEKDLFEALKGAGIDRKRLELADIGSRLGKIGRKDKDAFRQKVYQLKLTSAGELEKFLEKVENVQVDNIQITKITHSDIENLKVGVKTEALKAARTKADYLLKAIGAEVGKPLMIRDWEMEPVQPLARTYGYAMENVQMENQGMATPETEVAFRKIKLQAQITAQFEIK